MSERKNDVYEMQHTPWRYTDEINPHSDVLIKINCSDTLLSVTLLNCVHGHFCIIMISLILNHLLIVSLLLGALLIKGTNQSIYFP